MQEMLEPIGYRNIQKDVEQAVEYLRKTFDAFGVQQNLIAKLDKSGQLADCRKSVAKCLSKAQEMWDNLDIYLADYQCVQKEGTSALTQEQLNEYRSGKFWELTGVGAAITGYMSYQFRFQAGKSFAEDYNDLYQFKNGKIFWQATFFSGFGELSNYELWFGGQDYIDARIQDALKSMLQGIPDIAVEKRFSTGFVKKMGEELGIENADDWFDQVNNLVSQYAASKKPINELLKDEKFQELLDTMTGEESEIYLKMLEKVYDRAQTLSDIVGNTAKVYGYIDKGLKFIDYCLCDYSEQVVYLDSMRDALLNAGYQSGGVLEQIEKVRDDFTKAYLTDTDKLMEKLEDYAVDKGIDKIKGQLMTSIPVLKKIDLGLTILDTGADIAFADQKSAYEALSGYAFMDYSLTQSYERYVELMEYGVATQADMEEADRIFQMLHSLKLQEYDEMRNLCKGKNQELYDLYTQKYEELKSFEKQYMAS